MPIHLQKLARLRISRDPKDQSLQEHLLDGIIHSCKLKLSTVCAICKSALHWACCHDLWSPFGRGQEYLSVLVSEIVIRQYIEVSNWFFSTRQCSPCSNQSTRRLESGHFGLSIRTSMPAHSGDEIQQHFYERDVVDAEPDNLRDQADNRPNRPSAVLHARQIITAAAA